MSDEEEFTTPVCDEEGEQQLLSEPLIFNGESGMRPSAEARRYVYRVTTMMLDHELTDRDGWMFGGIAHEADKRRLRKAIKDVIKELTKKSNR
jgi:hypothetical protein